MVQVPCAHGWDLEVERGPDWLFVRPHPPGGVATDSPSLAEQVWSMLEQSMVHRLVMELGDIDRLDNHLIEQLEWLHKRIQSHDGMMRICGLSSSNEELLDDYPLAGHFPHYRDREEAVMGQALPTKPR
jgi:anti-sigma B factor antagonist